MRTLVIVSQDKSDIFFANQLAKALDVVGIVVENQIPARDCSSLYQKSVKYLSTPGVFLRKVMEVLDRKFIERYQDYNIPENALDFGEEGRALMVGEGVNVMYTQGVNAINRPEYRSWIQSLKPDVIAVCGASILRTELLSIPTHGVLNLHGGLSQFYRGLFTTDWAIHNGVPEYVGATVHFVSEGVDDGDVVYQGRPEITADDNPNSLYEKVVRLGVQMMIRAITDIEQSRCQQTSLESKGQLYLHDMFDVSAKRATWRQVKKGVILDYLSDKNTRDQFVKESLINEFFL
ncbi:formyl transferase [Marinobacter lipolyticus]|uniref:formyl transferase n=1 Tax=Marinobacter lipolyticus TaxID=209639 RepID=UPI003A9597AD